MDDLAKLYIPQISFCLYLSTLDSNGKSNTVRCLRLTQELLWWRHIVYVAK